MSKLIIKVLNEDGELHWPDLDELFILSRTHEVFIKDPKTKDLLQVLDLDLNHITNR